MLHDLYLPTSIKCKLYEGRKSYLFSSLLYLCYLIYCWIKFHSKYPSKVDLNIVRICSWFLVNHLSLSVAGLAPAHRWKHLKLILVETDFGFRVSLPKSASSLILDCLDRWCVNFPFPILLWLQFSAWDLISSWLPISSLSLLSNSLDFTPGHWLTSGLVCIFPLILGSIVTTSGSRPIPCFSVFIPYISFPRPPLFIYCYSWVPN